MSDGEKYYPLVELYAKKFEIPAALVKAVCLIESSWDTWAYKKEIGFYNRYIAGNTKYVGSPWYQDPMAWGSFGLTQCLYSTALEIGFKLKYPWMLCEPETGIQAGCKYLRQKWDVYLDWPKSISAYNAGSYSTGNKAYVDKVLAAWAEYEKSS